MAVVIVVSGISVGRAVLVEFIGRRRLRLVDGIIHLCVISLVAVERHPHHPRHIDRGYKRSDDPDAPKDVVPRLGQIRGGERLVEDLIL